MTDDLDDDDLAGKRICAGCVGDRYLKRVVREDGSKAKCSYCGKRRNAMPLGEFSNYIQTAFENHYELTSETYGPDYEPVGSPVGEMIQELAEIEEKPAEDIRNLLSHRLGPVGKDALTEDDPFGEEAHYRERETYTPEHHLEWAFFRKSLTTEARLFNRDAENALAAVFGGIDEYARTHGKPVILDAGPGRPINVLYRARVFQSDEKKVEAAIVRPDIELGPPPPQFAVAGRMNARGIGVFYGATHRNVALAEVRPPVGSRVLIARFEIIKPVRLLDVGVMESIQAKGSIFDNSFLHAQERAMFLKTLSRTITQPVMPEDEASEYLVTQAIADYLATREEPRLDGIIYSSAQQRGRLKRNVVLFHKSARVEALDIPAISQIYAHTSETDEDGTRPNYWVHITKPPPKEKPERDFPFISLYDYPDPRKDTREPALRVDLPSVGVHYVTGVKFSDDVMSVTRIESVMSEEEAARRTEEAREPF